MNYYVDSGTVSHLWTVPLIFSRYWPTSTCLDFLCVSYFIFYWNVYHACNCKVYIRFLLFAPVRLSTSWTIFVFRQVWVRCSISNTVPETVEKVVERRDTGRKIVTKETQEGCLSFLIIRFWNFFKVSWSSPACRKDFFDKLGYGVRFRTPYLCLPIVSLNTFP